MAHQVKLLYETGCPQVVGAHACLNYHLTFNLAHSDKTDAGEYLTQIYFDLSK